MQLTHTFKVPATVDQTWAVLNDLERVALCFPGASMDTVDGDTFAGTVRLKLGPIVMSYVGSGEFTSRDAKAHRASIKAKGRDRSGNGTANVNVALALSPHGAGTEVEVVTELAITGRAAQFGSGVITEVSDRLLLEFVGRLSEELGHPATPGAETGGSGFPAAAPAADTLNFAQLVGPALAKRFGPPALATVVLAGLAFWLGRRATN